MGSCFSRGLTADDRVFLEAVIRMLIHLRAKMDRIVLKLDSEEIQADGMDIRLKIYKGLILDHIQQCVVEYRTFNHSQFQAEKDSYVQLIEEFELAINWVLHGNRDMAPGNMKKCLPLRNERSNSF